MKRLSISFMRGFGMALLMVAAACNSTAGDNYVPKYFDDCNPSIPPDECYSMRRDPGSDQVALAKRIARRYIDGHPIEREFWDWKSGVLMFAMTELYRVSDEPEFRDYYQSWLDYWIGISYQIVWSDSCPPAITAVALLQEAPSEAYQKVVDDTLEYLDVVAPRTDEGGISHNGILGSKSIWLDSLFMFGMVLNRWGELDDPARLDMMSEQVQIFADLLQDESGFMRHADDWPEYDENVYWARGNSWVLASLADYLRIRVTREESDPPVELSFRRHVRAVADAQQSSDLWLTVMSHPDEPDNYVETSASALFAYGMARAYRYGILGDEERRVAQDAVKALTAKIVDDGSGPIVTGISLATDPWPLDRYLAVRTEDDVSYGVGTVILALLETSGLPE